MRAFLPRTRPPCPILLSLALAACSETPPADRPAADTPAAALPAATDTVGLVGPVWRLVEFRGGDDTRLTPDDPAKYTLEFKPDGSVNARIDCNRGHGTWKSSGPTLELGATGTHPNGVSARIAARPDRQALVQHSIVCLEGRPSLPVADGRRWDLRV
jgi:hypothetical protein